MQWLWIIIAGIVGFGLGHLVCWLGRNDTATDAALAADKPTDGERAKPKVWVDKGRHEQLVALWKAFRIDHYFDPLQTLDWLQRERSAYMQDGQRLLRQRDYYQGKRPAHLAYRDRPVDELQRIRDQIDNWPESAMSNVTRERNEYRRMLRCYVGENEMGGINPLGETIQRHMFIQEQANQCGYSTILYSLSPSSSIFTPNYVNGFQQFAQQPAPSCAETSTSSDCVLKNVQRSNGLKGCVYVAHPRTLCPSCHRPMPTSYRQKCIPCRQALRQTL